MKRPTSEALREKRRAAAFKRWADPGFRERMSVAMNKGKDTRQFNRAVTWGDKIKAAQMTEEYKAKRGTMMPCQHCGIEFRAWVAHSKYCSKACRYDALYRGSVEGKARVLAANVLLGLGKQEILTQMLKNAIGSPCPYCRTELSLENLSLDHKTPHNSTALRKNKKENEEHRRHIDRRENLHIVCKRCNAMKSNMTHEQFMQLLDFLKRDEALKKHIETRLMRSNGFRRRFG